VEGNETVSTSAIEAELDTVGIRPGVLWSSLSFNEAERHLLEESATIGWLNVNRRGSVAYVTVKEKQIKESEIGKKLYSNIVASTDCVIEEITVKSGYPMVKAGDTVKAGQLLISGVIPSELGGGFVRAEGEVKGRVFERISVEVPRRETVTVYGEEILSECHANIFNFSINIFKNYGNLPDSYVIINDTEEMMLLGKWRLPVEIKRIYAKAVKKQSVERSDAELISIATSRLSALRKVRLSDAELLKIKTDGEFTESGYRMTSSVTVLCGIGEERIFSP
jgi:similar to stage IV sporulation protein